MKVRTGHWLRGPCEPAEWVELVFYNFSSSTHGLNFLYTVSTGSNSYYLAFHWSVCLYLPNPGIWHCLFVSFEKDLSIRKGFEGGMITVHSKDHFHLIRFQSGKARSEDARHDVGKILPHVKCRCVLWTMYVIWRDNTLLEWFIGRQGCDKKIKR